MMIFVPSQHLRVGTCASCHLTRTENEHETPTEPLSELKAVFAEQIKTIS